MKSIDLPSQQCGDIMKVSEGVVVLACPSKKTITIYRRKTMGQIFERTFSYNNYYGEEIMLISHLGGKQTFIFYTIRSASMSKVGMFEVLINELWEDERQLVIDHGDLIFPIPDMRNFGSIHLGGGDDKLLTIFNSFSEIKAYSMCNYKQQIDPRSGATRCENLLDKKQYTVELWESKTT